jgi:RimJ/RimL family protein N-acetyltransferase
MNDHFNAEADQALVNGLLGTLREQCRMVVSYSEQAGTAFGTPVITSRLAIHPWQEGDEKAIADFLNADAGIFPSRNHHYAYNVIGPFDEDRVRNEVFPAMREIYKSRPLFELYIRDRTNNQIVGMIDFSRDILGRDRVGYFVLPSERRHGYAFEAYAACIDRAVNTGLIRGTLYAHTDPDNVVSQKFLEKAGFYNLGPLIAPNNQGENHTVIAFSRVLLKDESFGPR